MTLAHSVMQLSRDSCRDRRDTKDVIYGTCQCMSLARAISPCRFMNHTVYVYELASCCGMAAFSFGLRLFGGRMYYVCSVSAVRHACLAVRHASRASPSCNSRESVMHLSRVRHASLASPSCTSRESVMHLLRAVDVCLARCLLVVVRKIFPAPFLFSTSFAGRCGMGIGLRVDSPRHRGRNTIGWMPLPNPSEV